MTPYLESPIVNRGPTIRYCPCPANNRDTCHYEESSYGRSCQTQDQRDYSDIWWRPVTESSFARLWSDHARSNIPSSKYNAKQEATVRRFLQCRSIYDERQVNKRES